ncbi:MAG: hypothetical protein IPM59_15410 [Chloracidobacterium sp.]|nr:hypothetical protein [Chloracidobacterium sp.]
MAATMVEMFECPTCYEVYKHYDDAEFCHPIRKVWVCSECKEEMNNKAEFDEHVKENHPIQVDSYGFEIVPQAELEAAGQQRLWRSE